jgi:hypothetical protein
LTIAATPCATPSSMIVSRRQTTTYGWGMGEIAELAALRWDEDIQYLDVETAIEATQDLITYLQGRISAMRATMTQ